MALSKFKMTLLSLVMVLAFANMKIALCHLVKGSVSCVDCDSHYDYSGIRILIKCDHYQHKTRPLVAITKRDGSFESNARNVAPGSANCHARLLGGPKQLYASSKRNMIHAKLVAADQSSNTFTTVAPLTFATSCSSLTRKMGSNCGAAQDQRFGSSKTVDLPIPPEYGFAPTSYYITPFMPIIGIP